MVHVETVDLSSRGVILPSDRVGMVIAQPYLSLTDVEPYWCTPETKHQQLQMLTDTLSVAVAARHGATKTHFTIFPEYSIPGLDGVALVEASLRKAEWPSGTIVIGGTDALSRQDLVTLTGEPGTHMDTTHNGLGQIAQNDWINCGITWVKAADGTVERWLQPKLFPAWLEQNVPYQGMFRGNSVFAFNGPFDNTTQYRFCSLICFDWVATLSHQKAWRWVMDGLGQQAARAQAELPLSWFFVIQCNRRPSDDSFLTQVNEFFDQTAFPNVRRERACLVFANSAGNPVPGRSDLYGNTSVIFSHQTLFADPKCHSTFCNGGPRFRSSTLLSAQRDILFRERGACIHSFAQVNPNSLNAGAAGKTIAVQDPYVFPLAGTDDPRAPSAPVPACVKWLNDELDRLPSLGAAYPALPLATAVNATHRQTVNALRVIKPQSITHAVKLAAQKSKAEHADQWEHPEVEAMEHLVHTLGIVSIGIAPPVVDANPAHATLVMNHRTLDLLAIRGTTHEACVEHAKNFLPLPRRQVLLVSRDQDNNPWRQRYGSFLRPENPKLGQERDITDPGGGSLHLGYRKLLDIFQELTTEGSVQGAISAELTQGALNA